VAATPESKSPASNVTMTTALRRTVKDLPELLII
jgi:hypothetical protein